MIKVTDTIALDDSELHYSAVRASGPGGQHVNTTDSAVQLRFDAKNSPALTHAVFLRLKGLAGSRMTTAGVIMLAASRHRSQLRNKTEITERLLDLIRKALIPPKPRKKTRPSKASVTRRLDAKSRASTTKKHRGKVRGDD